MGRKNTPYFFINFLNVRAETKLPKAKVGMGQEKDGVGLFSDKCEDGAVDRFCSLLFVRGLC